MNGADCRGMRGCHSVGWFGKQEAGYGVVADNGHIRKWPRVAVNWLDRRVDRFRRIAAMLFVPALAV
jgi:hypothetical protein